MKLTDQEIAEAKRRYPTIQAAIAFVEYPMQNPVKDNPAIPWDFLMALNLSPIEMLDGISMLLEQAANTGMIPMKLIGETAEQMLKPEFMTYLCGRMGCL